jgi:hypothetical protein
MASEKLLAEDLWRRAAAVLARLEGELRVPGLHGPVEVLRDRWGVPPIYARNVEDLVFAQGFVAAWHCSATLAKRAKWTRRAKCGQAGSSLHRCTVAGSAARLHCSAMHALHALHALHATMQRRLGWRQLGRPGLGPCGLLGPSLSAWHRARVPTGTTAAPRPFPSGLERRDLPRHPPCVALEC